MAHSVWGKLSPQVESTPGIMYPTSETHLVCIRCVFLDLTSWKTLFQSFLTAKKPPKGVQMPQESAHGLFYHKYSWYNPNHSFYTSKISHFFRKSHRYFPEINNMSPPGSLPPTPIPTTIKSMLYFQSIIVCLKNTDEWTTPNIIWMSLVGQDSLSHTIFTMGKSLGVRQEPRTWGF